MIPWIVQQNNQIVLKNYSMIKICNNSNFYLYAPCNKNKPNLKFNYIVYINSICFYETCAFVYSQYSMRIIQFTKYFLCSI